MKVSFTVLGEPKGKQRPKFTTAGKFPRAVTPAQTVNYENLVKIEYQRQCGTFMFDAKVPLEMHIYAYLSIPKSVSNKKRSLMLQGKIRPTKKPDWDNIGKIVADSLNKIAFYDDAQVVDSIVRKYYSENPRIEIIIKDIGGVTGE